MGKYRQKAMGTRRDGNSPHCKNIVFPLVSSGNLIRWGGGGGEPKERNEPVHMVPHIAELLHPAQRSMATSDMSHYLHILNSSNVCSMQYAPRG